MARSLTKEQAEILIELLSTSENFEAGKPQARRSALEAIARLGSLGSIAQASLASAAPQAAGAPQASTQQVSTPYIPPSVSYGSNRDDYKPALKDRSVVEALLEFHRQNAAPETRARPASKVAPSTFVQVEVPVVDAAPKKAPLARSTTRPILSPNTRTKK